MIFSKQEFDTIMSDDTKQITENIVWKGKKEDSEIVKFRVKISSAHNYPIFVDGSYNRYLRRLSYKIIHKEIGKRIYGLDMGKNHRNPDETMAGINHIHTWSDEYEDRVAYSANSYIFSSSEDPLGVWKEFCENTNIDFQGIMEEVPLLQSKIDFDLGDMFT